MKNNFRDRRVRETDTTTAKTATSLITKQLIKGEESEKTAK